MRYAWWVLYSVGLVSFSANAAAQTVLPEGEPWQAKVSMSVENGPIGTVVSGLARDSGLPLTVSGQAKDLLLVAQSQDIPLRDTLAAIASALDMIWVLDETGTYRLTFEPEKAKRDRDAIRAYDRARVQSYNDWAKDTWELIAPYRDNIEARYQELERMMRESPSLERREKLRGDLRALETFSQTPQRMELMERIAKWTTADWEQIILGATPRVALPRTPDHPLRVAWFTTRLQTSTLHVEVHTMDVQNKPGHKSEIFLLPASVTPEFPWRRKAPAATTDFKLKSSPKNVTSWPNFVLQLHEQGGKNIVAEGHLIWFEFASMNGTTLQELLKFETLRVPPVGAESFGDFIVLRQEDQPLLRAGEPDRPLMRRAYELRSTPKDWFNVTTSLDLRQTFQVNQYAYAPRNVESSALYQPLCARLWKALGQAQQQRLLEAQPVSWPELSSEAKELYVAMIAVLAGEHYGKSVFSPIEVATSLELQKQLALYLEPEFKSGAGTAPTGAVENSRQSETYVLYLGKSAREARTHLIRFSRQL